MAAKKTSFHKSVQAELDYEIIEEPEMPEEAAGACCICDDPNTTNCSPESWTGSILTLGGAQVYAYWLGR